MTSLEFRPRLAVQLANFENIEFIQRMEIDIEGKINDIGQPRPMEDNFATYVK